MKLNLYGEQSMWAQLSCEQYVKFAVPICGASKFLAQLPADEIFIGAEKA